MMPEQALNGKDIAARASAGAAFSIPAHDARVSRASRRTAQSRSDSTSVDVRATAVARSSSPCERNGCWMRKVRNPASCTISISESTIATVAASPKASGVSRRASTMVDSGAERRRSSSAKQDQREAPSRQDAEGLRSVISTSPLFSRDVSDADGRTSCPAKGQEERWPS